MKTKQLIPMSEIPDTVRDIAVAWVENYVPHGAMVPEIAQKHKLASDIENYAREYALQVTESKEKELKMRTNDLLDALDLKAGNGPTALSMLSSRVKELEKELSDFKALVKQMREEHMKALHEMIGDDHFKIRTEIEQQVDKILGL